MFGFRAGRAGMSVSFRFSLPRRFHSLALALVLVGLVGLSGCGDTYSESLSYNKRTDPVLIPTVLIDVGELPEPDRPGQLPLLRMTDFDDPRNPFHEKKSKLLAGNSPDFVDPASLTGSERDALEEILTERFGKPAHPTVDVKYDGVSAADTKRYDKWIADLKLDDETLKGGSRLYRLHCLQCHGLNGDGRGPTARWVNPHPRDYRAGVFKFQSVDQSEGTRKPRREDLRRTIDHGLEGTAMPAFNTLPEVELGQLVSYVIHLSIRGQAEQEALQRIVTSKEEAAIRAFLVGKRERRLAKILEEWQKSQDAKLLIQPGKYDASKFASKEAMTTSVQNGHRLFLLNCGTCHNDYGRQAPFKMDQWGTLVRAANLTAGVYRGGRRPIDFYWRIHSGIRPSGMAPQARVGGTGSLEPDQIWDVVNFLQVLPYPAMRKEYGIELN